MSGSTTGLKHALTPIHINGLEIKNRVVRTAHGTHIGQGRVNDDLIANPQLANQDPYDKGWFIVLKPDDWASVKPSLTPGVAVSAKYAAKMQAEGFKGCQKVM